MSQNIDNKSGCAINIVKLEKIIEKEKIMSMKELKIVMAHILEKDTKTYYPAIKVALIMYIQRHVVSMYSRPPLSRIMETRND